MPSDKQNLSPIGQRLNFRGIIFWWYLMVLVPIVLVFAIVWLMETPTAEHFVLVRMVGLYVTTLLLFHFIAWVGRKLMRREWVPLIDYFYLASGSVGILITMLRDADSHSPIAAGLLHNAAPWIVAALAMRITRTTIELFNWHR